MGRKPIAKLTLAENTSRQAIIVIWLPVLPIYESVELRPWKREGSRVIRPR